MEEYISRFISEGYEVFSSYPRPLQCINHEGDPEYLEYENSLKGVHLENLTFDLIGNVCWSPLNALGNEALTYFMPKLVEFTLQGLRDKTDYPFMLQFVGVVEDGPQGGNMVLLGFEQQNYILRVLYVLKGLFQKEFKTYFALEDLDATIEKWKI